MKGYIQKGITVFLIAILLSFNSSYIVSYAETNTEGDPPDNPGVLDEQTDTGNKGMVVTAHPEASKVGAEVLRQGGNAMDAAVAIQLSLNVVEPQMSGIGGGGFILYYDAASQEVSVLNSREKAPSGASSDMFLDPETGEPLPFGERVESGLSVGVPGTLKGLDEALSKWGTKSIDELIDPAITLAEEGHEVNWALANAIESNADKLAKTEAAKVFLPNGDPLKEGELLVQEDLAKTFKMIKKQGVDVFYEGEIANALAAEVQDRGGSMTVDDLKEYEIDYVDPVKGDFMGYDIYSMPPPSSGGLVVLQLLAMFEELDITQWDIKSTEKYHHLVEAYHLAYADRGEYMGDPNYVYVPSEGLLHPDYVKERIELINPKQANEAVVPGDPCAYENGEDVCAEAREALEDKEAEELDETSNKEEEANETTENDLEEDKETNEEEDTNASDASNSVEEEQGNEEEEEVTEEVDEKIEGETTHFTVADQWGNMVSFTTTIEQVFGSGMMIPEYGVMLNNELTDFDATPGGANEVAPNKRPLSSMSPTIVLKDGEPFMTVGSPGGTTIITSVAQVILNTIGYDQELKDAIEEPRLFSSAYPSIRWEYGVPSDVRKELVNMGHEWEESNVEIGNVNSLLIRDDMYYGAADSTREGVAIGLSDEDFEQALDFTILEEKINQAEALKESDSTKESWEALQEALTIAKDTMEKEDLTQEDIDKATDKLTEAISNLQKVKEEEESVDKSALEKLVEQLKKESIQKEKYAKEDWEKFKEALQHAELILSKEDATQDEIDAALKALQEARDHLEAIEKEETKEEESDDKGEVTVIEKNDETKDKEKEKEKAEQLPSTATTIFNIILIGALLIAVGLILFVLKKRRT